MEGKKFDDEKVPLWLLPKPALFEVAKVLQFGASKYAEWNWAKGMQWSRLLSASSRHSWAFECGENLDPETNLSHLAHDIACKLFLLQYYLSSLGADDRYSFTVDSMSDESLTLPIEREIIAKYATNSHMIVEVGVCYGGTSAVIRKAMPSTAVLHLVDPFASDYKMTWNQADINPSYERAKANVESVQNGSVLWYRTTSEKAAPVFAGQHFLADMIFIDGDHAYESVKKDWEVWSPLVREGGVVLFHDVTPVHRGVTKCYTEILRNNPDFEEVDGVASVKVIQRKRKERDNPTKYPKHIINGVECLCAGTAPKAEPTSIQIEKSSGVETSDSSEVGLDAGNRQERTRKAARKGNK